MRLIQLNREYVWITLGLAGLSLVFLGDFLRPPAGEYLGGGDVISFSLQGLRLAQSEVHAGRLPLWNPYLAGGLPLWANPEYGLLYLPNWIMLVAPIHLGLSWVAAFHLFWAGLGLYVWGRLHRLGPGGALVGALTFSYCGFVVVRIAEGSPNLIATLTWLPWVMAAVENSLRKHTLKSALLAGLPLAMAVYAGHPESGYHIGVLVLLRVLVEIAWPPDPPSRRDRWRLPLRQLIIAGIVASGLSAAQLLPTAELIWRSVRGGSQGYEFASQYSLPLAHLISIILPNFFGEPVRLGYWGENWHIEYILYPGLLALLLVGAAIRYGHGERPVRLWLGLAVLGLLLALGPASGLHRLAYGIAPLFGLARVPARFGFWTIFAVASLAAWAVDHLAHHPARQWGSRASLALLAGTPLGLSVVAFLFYTLVPREDARAYHIGAGLLAASLFLGLGGALLLGRPWFSGRVFVGLAALLTLADLWGYGSRELHLTAEGEATMWAQAAALIDQPDASSRWPPPRVLTFGMNVIFESNGMDVGLASVRAYEQLLLADYQSFIDSVPDPRATTFDLLNAEYLLIPADQEQWRNEPRLQYLGPAGDFAVYRRKAALPRAWIVPTTQVMPALQDTINAIHAPGFEPRAVAFVTDDLGCSAGTGGDAQITHFEPGVVTVSTNGSGLLILGEVWYPGWQATLDNQPVKVIKADGVLRGVCLPEGQHTVSFRFDPPLVKWGVGLTGITIILLAGSLVFLKERAGREVSP